jgi:hypothetical protein
MSQQKFRSTTTYRFQPFNLFDRYTSLDTYVGITGSQSNLQNNNINFHFSENFHNHYLFHNHQIYKCIFYSYYINHYLKKTFSNLI